MQPFSKSVHFGLAALAAVGLLAVVAPAAPAKESKQIESEGEFVSFDAKAETITVKITKPGKGATPPRALKLQNGKEEQFKVKTEGTVLTRTTVKLQDGTGGKFEDLKAGRKVKVFWMPDDTGKARMARSISVFVPAEEQGEDAGD
jgi:uncharacterized OB-fold protein